MTHSLDDYAALALALADDAPRRHALRDPPQRWRLPAPLFDVARYTCALEDQFSQMWQRHAAGLPPGTTVVTGGGLDPGIVLS